LGLVTDTRPTDTLVELVRGVDLLIAEAMYGSDEDQPRAVERKHMTFREAAAFASRAGVGELVLTHFSPSVTEPDAYAENARGVFAATTVGHDHLTRSLRFADD
jgi:ribonuclease Z